MIIAWPAGNSGIGLYFLPIGTVAGTLSMKLENTSEYGALEPIYIESAGSQYPQVGVSGLLTFNASAFINLAVPGSIRTIRDIDGWFPNLPPSVRDSTKRDLIAGGGGSIHRLWFDNVTTTTVEFMPVGNAADVQIHGDHMEFGPGTYQFNASFNYPQLQQLSPDNVLDHAHAGLIEKYPDMTSSLSFMSYTDKLLAGSWHYLTYFGRDTMLTLLLMQETMSLGKGGAVEAAIGSVLERVSKADGSTCHEETLGDYATYQNLQRGCIDRSALRLQDDRYRLLPAYRLEEIPCRHTYWTGQSA